MAGSTLNNHRDRRAVRRIDPRAGGVNQQFLGQAASDFFEIAQEELLELLGVVEPPAVRQNVTGIDGLPLALRSVSAGQCPF